MLVHREPQRDGTTHGLYPVMTESTSISQKSSALDPVSEISSRLDLSISHFCRNLDPQYNSPNEIMPKFTVLFSSFWRKNSKASKEAKGKEPARENEPATGKQSAKGKNLAKGREKAEAEDRLTKAAQAEETDKPVGAGVIVGRDSLSSAPSRYPESSSRATRKASVSTDHSEPRRGHRANRYVFSYRFDK